MQMITKHRGTLIKSTGDGVLATFDGPARAVRCARGDAAAYQRFSCRQKPHRRVR